MSEARKCDRCGKYLAINETSPNVDAGWRTLEAGYNAGDRRVTYDFCPECWESWDAWLHRRFA